jgi:hypothetical protein
MLLCHLLLPPLLQASYALPLQVAQQQFLETPDHADSPSPQSRSPKVSFAADVHSLVPGDDFPALSEGHPDDSNAQLQISSVIALDQLPAAAAADDDDNNVSKYTSLYSMPMREKVSQVLPCIFAGELFDPSDKSAPSPFRSALSIPYLQCIPL